MPVHQLNTVVIFNALLLLSYGLLMICWQLYNLHLAVLDTSGRTEKAQSGVGLAGDRQEQGGMSVNEQLLRPSLLLH